MPSRAVTGDSHGLRDVSGRDTPCADLRPRAGRRPCLRGRGGRSRGRSRGRRSRARRSRSARRSSIATPDSCTCWMISKLRSTRIGARPIDGSSISSSFGFDMSARPIATICCSPPDSVPGELRAPLVQEREELVHAVEVLLRAAAVQVRAHLEVLEHGHRREEPPVLGDDRHALTDPVARRALRHVLAVEAHRAVPRIARSRASSSASSTCPTRCRRAGRRARPRARSGSAPGGCGSGRSTCRRRRARGAARSGLVVLISSSSRSCRGTPRRRAGRSPPARRCPRRS